MPTKCLSRPSTSNVRSEQKLYARQGLSAVAFPRAQRLNFSDLGSSSSADRARAEKLLQIDIDFIDSEEFDLMYAAKLYPKCVDLTFPTLPKAQRTSKQGKNVPCLGVALEEQLFSFAEEQHEFRRMNFLKFAATRLRETLNNDSPSLSTMDQIERLLADSKAARDHIIRRNLRLVISLASKHVTTHYTFEELVSDGTLALMEAVEKFDYLRGFRFSTYATHAIRRSFFRKIERKQIDRQRFTVTDPDAMVSTPDDSEVDYDAPADSQMMAHIMNGLSDHLTERELRVIEGRYGLNGRTKPMTLVQLSEELGICKERVRQIEGIALKKLHAVAKRHSRAICNNEQRSGTES